ncbi:hypothetical protein DM01DRAFT_1339223 [Hesseltinella vesiculosa]|uniref:PHD-type domain-containing protein n=1 Tax=Hesseltinella vesiculosa TaxID=101127 RepID=A0A1X2G7T7_9FUNG|nr:hypothetical protein DM01DRAFT_1339223 [Hesseltinella vesiculosa]
MNGVLIKSIPRVLLARVLLQLFIIPQHLIHDASVNLLQVIQEALQTFGDGCDLDGFLTFCTQSYFASPAANDNTSDSLSTSIATKDQWYWLDAALTRPDDWNDLVEQTKNNTDCEPVGIRIKIMNETTRPCIKLIRYGKVASLQDDRLTCTHKGRPMAIDTVLRGTLSYLEKNESIRAMDIDGSVSSSSANLQLLIRDRLRVYDHVKEQTTKPLLIRSDFLLMGALMVHVSDPALPPKWCLYLRDYMGDTNGSHWRVLNDMTQSDIEIKIPSLQVLADLRGVQVEDEQGKPTLPSPWSKKYLPFYLFYCNETVVTGDAKNGTCQKRDSLNAYDAATSTSDDAGQDQRGLITIDDYTYDDEMLDYDQNDVMMTDEDHAVAMATCKVCHIADSIDNVNTIFFCDDCDQGVHQLCEDPPIQSFEMDLDPWYCRHCLARKGLPIPTPPAVQPSDQDGAAFKKRRIDLDP